MAYDEVTTLLGGWPGFRLVDVRRDGVSPEGSAPRIVLTLEPAPGAVRHCSRCGEAVAAVHEITARAVRDLPILRRRPGWCSRGCGCGFRAVGRRSKRCRGSIGSPG